MTLMNDTLDVLAFGAHPDDVEIMCAGTLVKLAQEGYKVGMISLTGGESGSRGTPQDRKKEFTTATAIMSLKTGDILDIPDGQVRVSEANKIKVIKKLRQYRPKIVMAPHWETRHPDHSQCSFLIRQAVFASGLKNLNTGQQHYRPKNLFYYMELYDFTPSFIIDISETFEIKLQAIRAHQSQFYNPNENNKEQEQTFISSPEFFDYIRIRAQYWGHKMGVAYGEPFYVREPLGLQKAGDLLHIKTFWR